MNSDSENFEQLRRLLALKRHEQPPPGYFNGFSSQVLARIRAGESDTYREPSYGSWWERLCTVFEVKPVFAGVFGAAVCAVLVSGIMTSNGVGGIPESPQVFMPLAVQGENLASGGVPPTFLPNELHPTPLNADSNSIAALFSRVDQLPLSMPVNYTLPGQ